MDEGVSLLFSLPDASLFLACAILFVFFHLVILLPTEPDILQHTKQLLIIIGAKILPDILPRFLDLDSASLRPDATTAR